MANHTVDATGANIAGIRWYEIRDPNGTPAAFQQGTYSPDSNHRWMASVAMDRQGNIATGFSVSSSTVYPTIRYAGRLVTDPPGELSQGEGTIIDGTASQIGTASRWGDYSDITVDPSDDCTFWYTTEYIQVTGERTWRTRIGSFKFPGCTGSVIPTPTVAGPTHTATPIPPATATPCAGSVSYTGSITNTDGTQAGRVGLRSPGSTCAAPKSCAALGSSEAMHYDSYTYANSTGSAQCVTVTVNESCGNNTLWSVAYLNTYNPTSLCINYLADGGRGGPITVYSFNLPAGASAVIVVHEVSPNVGCASYTLNINPCGGGPVLTPTLTSTPTATSSGSTPTPTVPIIPTITVTPCTMPFTDVLPTDYFYEAVRYLYCHGAISGYGTVFLPYNLTTRGQLCKIVVLAEGFPTYTPPIPTFRDVSTDHTFYSYIETAYHQDIISGYTCGTGCLEFRPGNNVTRGQLCKIVVIAEGWTFYIPPTPTFMDVPASDPFYSYIETAYFHEIISGYSCGSGCLEFRPGASATRGQISKIVYNAVTGP